MTSEFTSRSTIYTEAVKQKYRFPCLKDNIIIICKCNNYNNT